MDKGLYTKNVDCPVCKNVFAAAKVMSAATRVVKRDEDFCPHYEPINSLLYNVWVCSECGYAALDDKFEGLSDKEAKAVKMAFKNKWVPRDFTGERNMNAGIEAYKLALLNAQIRGAKSIEISRICMRIAWLYRILEDPKEKEFLKFALTAYKDVFEKEHLPVENLDEVTCAYMIGELHRRLGENAEAAKWYYKAISFKDQHKDDPKIGNVITMARDQLQAVKEKEESGTAG